MSAKERDRMKVMSALVEGRLKQVEAARLMRLSVRHVRRLQERYAAHGDGGLVHRSRGRPSVRRLCRSLDARHRPLRQGGQDLDEVPPSSTRPGLPNIEFGLGIVGMPSVRSFSMKQYGG